MKNFICLTSQIYTINGLFMWSYGYNITHFNTNRPHYGKYMNGKIHFEMLSKLLLGISKTICYFPPILLDFVSFGSLFIKEETQKSFATYIGVRNVFDTYYNLIPLLPPITLIITLFLL